MQFYIHQQKIIQKRLKKVLLAWNTGTGKSAAALELAKNSGQNILIIVPKSIKQQWAKLCESQDIKATLLTKEEFRKNAKHLPRHNCLIVDEAHFFAGMKSAMSKALRREAVPMVKKFSISSSRDMPVPVSTIEIVFRS